MSNMQKSIDALIKIVEDHRKERFITCEETCWCWEMSELIQMAEEKKTICERNSWT